MASIKVDPEIGGEKLNANVELARKAMGRFGTPAFRQLLDDTGFGDHPEFFRMMVKIGAAMGEAEFIDTKARSITSEPDSLAQRMFGNMVPKQK